MIHQGETIKQRINETTSSNNKDRSIAPEYSKNNNINSQNLNENNCNNVVNLLKSE
jgi:hypothetical protein